MKRTIAAVVFTAGWLAISGAAWAQEHVHNAPASTSNAPAGKPFEIKDEIAIFCPTMKTGQLCSSGTANILKLKGDQAQQWVTAARKFNKAVDAATLQLFKDSETMLTPQQQELLKAWFAVGLNPQMNDLLFAKGLGPDKAPEPAASATKK